MRRAIVFGSIALTVAALAIWWQAGRKPPIDYYVPPNDVNVTYFPSPRPATRLPLVVAASIDSGFMRPFIVSFQEQYRTIPIAYIQARSSSFFARALADCKRRNRAADIYLTSSTDQLVRLANENCAHTLSGSIASEAPGQAAWRNQVIAFTVEPAAFVFSKNMPAAYHPLPKDHIGLIEWLRRFDRNEYRVGTYDIEASAEGYNLAASDSRQAALYGRLLESLGRTNIKLYCCSNVMVDAVDRGDIFFAYNVQLSYAYAAQRAGSRIAVVLPNDYRAVQTLSLMVPRGARAPDAAEELAAFLVSPNARSIARRDLMPPGMDPVQAADYADQILAQASVTPALLSLQDKSRRDHLIREWREAIKPAQSLRVGK